MGKTGKAAATYISLAGFQRGVAILILPFVTHVMPVADYGAASVLTAATSLLTALMAAPLIQIIVRAAARGESDGPALLRVAGTYCYFLFPAAVTCIALTVALVVPGALGIRGTIWGIELLAIGFQAAPIFAMWVSRAREDFRRFVWLSLTSILTTAMFKVVFVIVLRLGVLGWVTSDLVSSIASTAVAIMLVRLPRARLDSRHVRYVWRFTLPLIPHSASVWALGALSRPVMSAVSTLEQVGLLSFGSNLVMIAGLVLGEGNAALLPHYARENFPAPTRETLGPVRFQVLGAMTVPALVGCGVAAVGRWIFAETYWPSFFVAGLLLIGQLAYGLYVIPMNYLTQTAGTPKYSAVASGAGAVVVLVLILALGHSFGAVGVACITTAGYATMAVMALLLTRMHKLQIHWSAWLAFWPELVLAAAALSCAVAALAFPVGSAAASTSSGIGLALVLGVVFLAVRRKPAEPLPR